MAFADPLVIAPSATANGAMTATSWDRIKDGMYRLSTSTLDEPRELILDNTIIQNGPCRFLFSLRFGKNPSGTPLYGQPKVADHQAVLNYTLRYDPVIWTAAEVEYMRNVAAGFTNSAIASAKWLSGQR